MAFLESPPQITPLSTKFMREIGGVLQLDKYRADMCRGLKKNTGSNIYTPQDR